MKNNLYIITLEPIEQRYSKQWYTYWKKEFSKSFNVNYIDGHQELKEGIDKGCFLDINKTNYVKAEQVKKLSLLFQNNKIKDGDRFIFMDGWDFAITALRYMSQLQNINIKIYAYWHAGSWDKYDFISQAGLGEWARHNECGWFNACDGNFVATNFHKKIIEDYFGQAIDNTKIHVVGFPMDWMKEINKRVKILDVKKEDLIVFPHRLDKEKCPEVFDNLAKLLPKYKFVKTLEVTKNKKDYYNLLKKAKIVFSASKQETFGIGTVEALMMGVVPIVPNDLSYVELYNSRFRYNTKYDAKQKIEYIMEYYGHIYSKINKHLINRIKQNQDKIKTQSLDSIKKMTEVMLK